MIVPYQSKLYLVVKAVKGCDMIEAIVWFRKIRKEQSGVSIEDVANVRLGKRFSCTIAENATADPRGSRPAVAKQFCIEDARTNEDIFTPGGERKRMCENIGRTGEIDGDNVDLVRDGAVSADRRDDFRPFQPFPKKFVFDAGDGRGTAESAEAGEVGGDVWAARRSAPTFGRDRRFNRNRAAADAPFGLATLGSLEASFSLTTKPRR